MASIIPAGVYGLRVPAGAGPIPASLDGNAAFRITMAAIDPSAPPSTEDGTPRATLKLVRVQSGDDDEDDEDWEDEDDVDTLRARLREAGVLGSDDDSDLSEDDDSEEETNGGPSDPAKSKKAKREALEKKLKEDLAAEEMELDQMTSGANGKSKGKGKALNGDVSSDSEDDEDEDDDEVEQLVLCTLDPEKNWQQTMEITVREGEEIYFESTGTHDIYLTGNYVAIPDAEDDDSEDGDYSMDYDLSPDEDELDADVSEDDALDGLPDPRVLEVDSDDEEPPKLVKADKKNKNKRPADSSDDEGATLDDLISKTKAQAPATNGEQKLSKKQAKKLKNNEGQAVPAAQEPAKKQSKDKAETPSSDKKKVQFAKNLELGPTGSPKVEETKAKPTNNPRTVQGVTVDDKKEGKGRPAKAGDKIEMRYIGKLANGKQFDANKKGKPFSFKLGVGEVIKGWDVGVVGMKAGGERRLTIPAKLGYGNKAIPGIPANSELIFDIKCISVN
ncbi:hypothetical protein K458DRAFT_321023 [Lentithecium fluviatile CBS 122367]|uniref:peptidylprolyl isomerase n=1 Tax=Lentithecium fluviatile CBS 122367 TaxID=1168545 RepID=A0A6G1IF40_9PLEO|nr:hypothetical protein K458DRAFT_321023 [Lentithecium fluviatile CBS 122367]